MPKDKQHKTPLVSVVMATYNGEEYIDEAIQSILDQTYSNFEFIIVDDGSTDKTSQIVKSYTDNRIIYVKKDKNSGIADSLNIGIAKSSGIFIARMDDDDISLPNRFTKQLEYFQKHQDIVACSTSGFNKDKYIDRGLSHKNLLLHLLFYNPILHPSVMFRRDVLENNLYDSNFVPTEDYELWSRLIFRGKFLQISEPLMVIRSRPTSITAKNRRLQLEHTKIICDKIYTNIGLAKVNGHDIYYNTLISKSYDLSPINLSRLIQWSKKLKYKNHNQGFFKANVFNSVLEKQVKNYIVSYFKNNSKQIKLKSFVLLPMNYKLFILSTYLKRI